jgi:hypothetical protein
MPSGEKSQLCDRWWSGDLGATPRGAVEEVLSKLSRGVLDLEGALAEYLSTPVFQAWLGFLSLHEKAAGRTFLIQVFFRAIYDESTGPGIQELARRWWKHFNNKVATKIRIPANDPNLNEGMWAELRLWLFHSLREGREAGPRGHDARGKPTFWWDRRASPWQPDASPRDRIEQGLRFSDEAKGAWVMAGRALSCGRLHELPGGTALG